MAFSNIIFTKNAVGISGIRTWIFKLEGEHAGHLTQTTAVSYYTLMPSIIDSKSWINLYKKIIARIVAIRRGSVFSKYRKNIFFSRKRLVSVGHIQKPVESNLGNLEINFRNLTWNSFPSVLNKKLPRFNIKSIIL